MSHTETLEQAHHLLDSMAPSQVSAVVTLLQSMLDPASRAISNAPVDDEFETEEERRAVAASKAEYAENPAGALDHDRFLAQLEVAS